VRDDGIVTLRFGVGIGRFVAADVGVSEDTARIEPALRLGARVRPWEGACWRARWQSYVRGELAIVGATYIGSNYDLVLGVGHWARLADPVPWLAWYAELDGVARVGDVDTLALRVQVGLAFTTASFWR
jgi:hypothetical protein